MVEQAQGTPHGGPLSPLLANVLADEVDKALEARGYSFTRDADDCYAYADCMKAGQLVKARTRRQYAAPQFQINEANSPLGNAFGCKLLGYEQWLAKGREIKCAAAHKITPDSRASNRHLTGRSGGRSMEHVVQWLRPYMLGWNAYVGLAQTPKLWQELGEWLRQRLRATWLKYWKRPTTIDLALKALSAGATEARRVAGTGRANCNAAHPRCPPTDP